MVFQMKQFSITVFYKGATNQDIVASAYQSAVEYGSYIDTLITLRFVDVSLDTLRTEIYEAFLYGSKAIFIMDPLLQQHVDACAYLTDDANLYKSVNAIWKSGEAIIGDNVPNINYLFGLIV